MAAFIIILIIAAGLIAKNIRIVPQTETYIIERLGKFKTIWEAGLHVKVPFIDQITSKVSLKEQVLDFPPQPVITKDRKSVV